MSTLRVQYCRQVRCRPEAFVAHCFERCLYRRALPFVTLLGGLDGSYFSADRQLLEYAGQVQNAVQLREEIVDYFLDPQNDGWLRRVARIRLSTHRLLRLAQPYLGPSHIPVPPPSGRDHPIPLRIEPTGGFS